MESEAEGSKPGAIPNAYRNALFWHWAREMPKAIPPGFVSTLYAMASAADPFGRVKFKGGKAIRISDIAKGARVDEKAARRFINAAIASGVLAVEGEQRRGVAALYILVVSPFPDWGAALSVIESTRRAKKSDRPPPWEAEKFGTPDPELWAGPEPEKFGTPDPELWQDWPDEVRDAGPRLSSGRRTPNGSGRRTPNIPCSIHVDSTVMADVGGQPQEGDGLPREEIFDNQEEQGWGSAAVRCRVCHKPMATRHGRTVHAHCVESPPDLPPVVTGTEDLDAACLPPQPQVGAREPGGQDRIRLVSPAEERDAAPYPRNGTVEAQAKFNSDHINGIRQIMQRAREAGRTGS